MDIMAAIFIALVLLGLIVMLLALQRFQPDSNLKAVVEKRITEIDTRTNMADYNSLRTALIDYDTLLDHVLKDKGIRGTNMGERLKSARSYFPHGLYNEIWEAHKMRNNLVHEATFTASVPALQRNREALKRAITQTSGVRKATRTA